MTEVTQNRKNWMSYPRKRVSTMLK